jgi:hypothetical protein
VDGETMGGKASRKMNEDQGVAQLKSSGFLCDIRAVAGGLKNYRPPTQNGSDDDAGKPEQVEVL